MKALVTGAGGLIGTAVLARAATNGAEVRAQLGPSNDPSAAVNGVPFVQCDITDAAALSGVADDIDVVIHLAGPPSVADSFTDPAEHLRVHVLGTETIVELCRSRPGARLVYVSSAEVYGRATGRPVPEDTLPAPRSPYAAAKLAAEGLVGAAVRYAGLDAIVLRPFSVYGPRMRTDSVLGTVLDQALAGGPIQLDDLRPVRDYCYVDDVAAAVWLAAAAPPADGLRVFNVGTGVGTSVHGLAAATLRALGRDERIEQRPFGGRPPTADIPLMVADVRRARQQLAWEATTPLIDGLHRAVEWYALGGSPR